MNKNLVLLLLVVLPNFCLAKGIDLTRPVTCEDHIGGHGILQPFHDGLIQVTLQANQKYPQTFGGIRLIGLIAVLEAPELLKVLNLELTRSQVYLYANRRARTHGNYKVHDHGERTQIEEGGERWQNINIVYNTSIGFRNKISEVVRLLVLPGLEGKYTSEEIQQFNQFFSALNMYGGTQASLDQLYRFLAQASDEVLEPVNKFRSEMQALLVADSRYAKDWKVRYAEKVQEYYFHLSLAKANGKHESLWPNLGIYTNHLIDELAEHVYQMVRTAVKRTFPNMPEDEVDRISKYIFN